MRKGPSGQLGEPSGTKTGDTAAMDVMGRHGRPKASKELFGFRGPSGKMPNKVKASQFSPNKAKASHSKAGREVGGGVGLDLTLNGTSFNTPGSN